MSLVRSSSSRLLSSIQDFLALSHSREFLHLLPSRVATGIRLVQCFLVVVVLEEMEMAMEELCGI